MRQSLLTSRGVRLAALLACLGSGLVAVLAARGQAEIVAQSPPLFFPDLQFSGASAGRLLATGGDSRAPAVRSQARAGLAQAGVPDAPDAMEAQEGFGTSVIELQSLDDRDETVEIEIAEKRSGERAARVDARLAAGGSTSVDLAKVSGLSLGDYAAWLRGEGRFGAISRTRWANGAAAAYRAPEADSELIIPLFVSNVLGQSTIFSVQNTRDDSPNEVQVSILDNDDGGTVQYIEQPLEPGQTASWDTFLDKSLFNPPAIPDNAHGGYVGSVRLKSNDAVSGMAYGDALQGKGSSAFAARPVALASPQQFLPLVRAGLGGDSLIGIANPENRAIDVTLTYRGAPFAPPGSGEGTTQRFKIGPRGTAIIDLSERDRGNQPPPALGRFAGSAAIQASGPVLAATIEDRRVEGKVDGIAAYNAFGPQDLGTVLAFPLVRRATDYATTAFAVYNPGSGTAHVEIELRGADDRPAGNPALDVAGGDVAWLSLSEVPGFAAGTGRARLVASRPVAVLAYEERDITVKPPPKPLQLTLSEIMDSGTAGSARLSQNGSVVDVEIRLDGGASASASINEGVCSFQPGAELYPLEAVDAGFSLTKLTQVSLTELSTGANAIRIHGPGFGGRRRQLACAIIPYVARAEDTDLSVVEALVVESAELPPTETPTAMPPTETPTTPPSATSTPVGPNPTTPPGPTSTPGTPKIYLPFAQNKE